MVDTVNKIRERNTNLKPIYIPMDDGQIFTLPVLSYRERLALATKLLVAITDHPSTARHQVPITGTVIRQMTTDSLHNLAAEKAEDDRIERELKEEAEQQAVNEAAKLAAAEKAAQQATETTPSEAA